MKTAEAEAKALKGILAYIETKKPTTLAEALHMLDLISVIASETLAEAAPINPIGTKANVNGTPVIMTCNGWRAC